MKERWKEELECEKKVGELLEIVAEARDGMWTPELLDRARDFVWRCLGGHVDAPVIEATALKVVRALNINRTWTREEVIQILDAAHREGAATIKQRFLADLPLTGEDA